MSFALNGKVEEEEEENRGRLLLQDLLDGMTLLGEGIKSQHNCSTLTR